MFAPKRPKIEWERWLGVRGAAVLGGIFLAVAGVLFFQYSIERDMITKEMRVAMGATIGVACLVGGEVIRRRHYALTANAISGAGVVILYAAFWSAHLLGIFPFGLSFALMVAVTALCCFLAWRNASQLIAWLGLSGGFATPLLLSTGRDEPIALFSYLLLLDMSFLFVANRRRWPLVGTLGLLGTFAIQGAWFFMRMSPATFGIGIVSLGVFAMVFAFLAPSIAPGDASRNSERLQWLATRVGAVLVPFVFAASFASRVDVGYHLYPLILLSALLAAASGWMARKQGAIQAPLGAAAGAVAIALVWVLSNTLETPRAWELVVCALFACGVLHFFCEWRRAGAGAALKGHDAALTTAVSGMTVALFIACFRVSEVNLWPLCVGFTLLPLFLLRLDALSPWLARPFLACVPAGVGVAVWLTAHAREPGFADTTRTLLAVLGVVLVFLAAATARKASLGRRMSFAATAVACVPLFTPLEYWSGPGLHEAVPLLNALALGICMLLAASGARAGLLVGLAAAVTILTQWVMQSNHFAIPADQARGAVVVLLGTVALFVLWPLLRRSPWEGSRTIAWTAPLAAIFGLAPAMEMWTRAYGHAGKAVPPASLALVLLVAAAWTWKDRRAEFRAERRGDRTSIAVLGIHALALAAAFLGFAVASQLDRARGAPTFAALCLAAAVVWRRTDHAPLKYISLFAAAGATLSAAWFASNERHETFPIPLLSGHGFDFLVPGAALVAAALVAYALEVPRVRPREKELYAQSVPLMSGLVILGGLAVILVWITVEVENHFTTANSFLLEFGDFPARDLSLSIAWALFAMVLLLVGMRRRAVLLRWVSLVLLLATIGKVFLLDLHDLRGLYRVGSFLGLAMSLLAVSLLYQRFVFRRERPDPA